MSKTKLFADARTVLVKLAAFVTAEAKLDPRLARTKKRTDKLVSALDMALKKYETVLGRKVTRKIKKRKAQAGAAKKAAKKPRPTAEVIELKPATAAARKRAAVKRSAKR